MNFPLVRTTVQKKGIFFLPAEDLHKMVAGKASTTFEELSTFLNDNGMELIKRSVVMYVIKKAGN